MSDQGLLPGPPTQAGFLQFLRGIVGIPSSVLPDNSLVISYTFGSAMAIVDPYLACIPPGFTYAVYNLGAHFVIMYAPDLPDAPIYKCIGPDNCLPYFSYMRASFGMNSFVAGVVNSTSDEGTSESLTVPDWVTGLTIDQLGLLQTPWGRTYLGWAQKFGSLWGVT